MSAATDPTAGLLAGMLLVALAGWIHRRERRKGAAAAPASGDTVALLYLRWLEGDLHVGRLEVAGADPLHARAWALSQRPPGGSRVVDCRITTVPLEARVGRDQDGEPYRSPVYDQVPTARQVLDDEERRRRFVAQAVAVATYLRTAA